MFTGGYGTSCRLLAGIGKRTAQMQLICPKRIDLTFWLNPPMGSSGFCAFQPWLKMAGFSPEEWKTGARIEEQSVLNMVVVGKHFTFLLVVV